MSHSTSGAGEAIDPDARLLSIPRSKGDQEGEGVTAYLSPRTVRAIAAWLAAAGIEAGPVFRRVNGRRYKAKAARRDLALTRCKRLGLFKKVFWRGFDRR